MFRIGLNPYGVAYSVGLFGAGTPRANPKPLGLNGFLDLADSIGAQGVELPIALLKDVPETDTDRVRARIHANGRYAILMHGISWGDVDAALVYAQRFAITTVRMHLTSVLSGARAALGENGAAWRRLYDDAVRQFRAFAQQAGDCGVAVTLENHQDLTSAELIEICESSGPHVGVCLDTGNPYAVGETPLEFALAIKKYVRQLHLKDYKIHPSRTGYRLARCALGAGVVPFAALAEILASNDTLPASIEPGALCNRHVELFDPCWWDGYAPRSARDLAGALSSALAQAKWSVDEYRTPWEQEASAQEVVKYEMQELGHSVVNLQEMGLWE